MKTACNPCRQRALLAALCLRIDGLNATAQETPNSKASSQQTDSSVVIAGRAARLRTRWPCRATVRDAAAANRQGQGS